MSASEEDTGPLHVNDAKNSTNPQLMYQRVQERWLAFGNCCAITVLAGLMAPKLFEVELTPNFNDP